VTKQQWAEIEPRLLEFREEAQENCRRLQGLRDEMLELLAAPEPDMEAIRAKQEKILEGHRRMQELVLNRLLEEKKVLTIEQQEKLFSMMRERMGCPGPGGLMRPGRGHGGGIGRSLRNPEEN
jgi:Spy/CpxP family protein refolding chaperone